MWSVLFGITIGCVTQTVDGADRERDRTLATARTNQQPHARPTRAERLCGKIDPAIAREIRFAAEKLTPPGDGTALRGEAIRGVRKIIRKREACAKKLCDSPDVERCLIAVVEQQFQRRNFRTPRTDPHQFGVATADLKRFCTKVDLSLVTEFGQYASADPVFDRDQPRAASLRAMREWCRRQRQSGYELDRCLVAVIDEMRGFGIMPMVIGEAVSGLIAVEWKLAYAVLEVKRKGFCAFTRAELNRERNRPRPMGLRVGGREVSPGAFRFARLPPNLKPEGTLFREDYVNNGRTRYPFPRLLPKIGSIGMIDAGRVDQVLSHSQAVILLPWGDARVVVRDLTNTELTAGRECRLSNKAFQITGEHTYTGPSGEPITLHTASPVEVDWVKLRAWLDARLPKKKRR